MSELLKVDFSKTTLPNQLGTVTPEQQETLKKLALNKGNVAFFTEAELEKFKKLILKDPSPELEDFIIAQLDEGLSSSDISGEPAEYSEALNACDTYAHEILFGQNGVLGDLNLNATAKDHISVSFSMSLLELMAPDGAVDMEKFKAIIDNKDNDFTDDIVKKLQLLKDTPNITIDGVGEKNSICMNVNEGKSFFDDIFLGTIQTSEEIKNRLESANTLDDISTDFSDLNTTILSQIKEIAEKNIQNGTVPNLGNNAVKGDENLSPFESMLKYIIDAFKDLLKAFTGFFSKGDSKKKDEPNAVVDNGDTSINVSEKHISDVGNFFNSNKTIMVDSIQGNSFKELFSDPKNISGYAKSIVDHVTAFGGNDTIQDNLRYIFVETLPDKKDNNKKVPRIERFMQEMNSNNNNFSIKNLDGSINIVNLQLLIHNYQEFTIWKTNATQAEEVVMYQEFFSSQKKS